MLHTAAKIAAPSPFGGHEAVAVVLDLVDPALTGRRRDGSGRNARGERR
jgi:hypothetical protein